MIILFSNKIPPVHFGGMEVHALYLLKHLKELGKEVVLVTFAEKDGPTGYYRYTYQGLAVPAIRIPNNWREDPEKIVGLLDIIQEKIGEEIEAIFHNSLQLFKSFCSISEKFPKAKQTARSGGNDVFYMIKQYTQELVVDSINCLNNLIVNSDFSAQRFESLGIASSKMEVFIGGGALPQENSVSVSRDSLGIMNDETVVISCCRFVDFKGLEDAVISIALARQSGAKIKYLLVGDGKKKTQIEDLVMSLDLESAVIMPGCVSPEQISDYLRMSDIYLSTSRMFLRKKSFGEYFHTETMGRSIIEAMLHGLAVVATAVGGVPEVVDSAGILLPEHKPVRIAKEITDLHINSNRKISLGGLALERAQKSFTFQSIFARYEKFW